MGWIYSIIISEKGVYVEQGELLKHKHPFLLKISNGRLKSLLIIGVNQCLVAKDICDNHIYISINNIKYPHFYKFTLHKF